MKKRSGKKPVGRPFTRLEVPGLTPAALAEAAKSSFSLDGAAGKFGISKATLMRRMGEIKQKPLLDAKGAPSTAELTHEAAALSLAWYSEEGRKRDALRRAIWRSALGSTAFSSLMEEKHTGDEIKPNPISQIWLSKNELGWSDKNLLESKYQGDPKRIPDDELMSLVKRALEKVGGIEHLGAAEDAIKKMQAENPDAKKDRDQ